MRTRLKFVPKDIVSGDTIHVPVDQYGSVDIVDNQGKPLFTIASCVEDKETGKASIQVWSKSAYIRKLDGKPHWVEGLTVHPVASNVVEIELKTSEAIQDESIEP